jgi:hypothetical protein
MSEYEGEGRNEHAVHGTMSIANARMINFWDYKYGITCPLSVLQ